MAALSGFLAWVLPLTAHDTDAMTREFGYGRGAPPPSTEGADAGGVLPSAVDVPAMSTHQRVRAYVGAPLVVSALRLLSHAATTSAGLEWFASKPEAMAPVLRASRAPWAEGGGGGVQATPGGRGKLSTLYRSSLLRCVPSAMAVLLPLAGSPALRAPLLALGAPILILQTCVTGALWRGGGAERDATDVEAGTGHRLPLWPLRASSEAVLRALCDPPPPLGQGVGEDGAPLTPRSARLASFRAGKAARMAAV